MNTKKYLILIWISVLCLNTTSVLGQIRLMRQDLPVVSDTVRYSLSASDVSQLIGQTGANQVWDAMGLVPNFQEIASFRSPISINFLFGFAFGSSTYGVQSTDFSAGIIQGEDVYDFFSLSNQAQVSTGRAFSVQGIPLTQTWSDTLLKFPLEFGHSYTRSFVSNQVNALVATIRTSGTRETSVEGWGTLSTPFGTFDCIQVRSNLRITDTIRTQFAPNFPIPVTRNQTEYRWFAKGEKIPILEVIVIGGFLNQTTVRFKDRYNAEAFKNLARIGSNKTRFVWNNDQDTCVLQDNSLRNPVSRQWNIQPQTGYRLVGGSTLTDVSPKILFTEPGSFDVSLSVFYNAGRADTTATSYLIAGLGPEVGFYTPSQNITTQTVVELIDTSAGEPNSWEWIIEPDHVDFIGGTLATSQNPRVVFNQAGLYSVTLIATNEIGSNVLTKEAYIKVDYPASTPSIEHKIAPYWYPNPASNQVFVENITEKWNVFMTNTVGMRVWESTLDANNTVINVQNLAEGVYYISLLNTTGDVLLRKPIVIQR